MKRKMTAVLERWKSNPDKLAMVVTGSRQIGKTYIIDEFARNNYENYLYIDLSLDSEARGMFKGDISAKSLLGMIALRYPRFKVECGKSILFLDEIQMCPGARSAIKPLVADGRLDVVASGSLLTVGGIRFGDEGRNSWRSAMPVAEGEMREDGAVADTPLDATPQGDFEERARLREGRVSPMGYETVVRMYAMDFEEYLWALGVSEEQTAEIRARVRDREPFPQPSLEAINRYFRFYMAVGGLPRAVLESLKDPVPWNDVRDILRSDRNGYKSDVVEYAPPPIRDRVLACIETMPVFLGKSNKRFVFSAAEGSDNVGWREYENPVAWVTSAGMATPCWNVTEPVMPLKSRRDNMLKLYNFDTGLLLSSLEASDARTDLMASVIAGDAGVNQGAIVENAVASMMEKCGFELHYMERDRRLRDGTRDRIEIDFIVDLGGDLAAVEVKSGKNRRSGSLEKLRTDPGYSMYPVKRFIKLENSNVRVDENGVEHYPLFAAAFMDSMAGGRGLPERIERTPLGLRRRRGAALCLAKTRYPVCPRVSKDGLTPPGWTSMNLWMFSSARTSA